MRSLLLALLFIVTLTSVRAQAPLILTPLIEQGRIQEALAASQVNAPEFRNVKSYSGYLTVNKTFDSNLFFWFFPAQINYEKAPVLLWLQGGPGASSLFGLFVENGPFHFLNDRLTLRPQSWAISHSVLYIDNPVGTGYSFTNGGYAQNQTQVGSDLYNALQQFFTLFSNLQSNRFFITGESYAGKYVPALAYTIHQKNIAAKLKINLQGLAIGNGYIDPRNQINYADYLYQHGLIDTNAREIFRREQDKIVAAIDKGDYKSAFYILDDLIGGDLISYPTHFRNFTGFRSYFNYLYSGDSPTNVQENLMKDFIQRADIRAAIHVGNATFHQDNQVEKHLLEDIQQSVAPWLVELLNHYKVLLYSGQLDIIVAYPLTENFLDNLKFRSSNDYKNATRIKWKVDNQLAGYVKTAGNLTEVLVLNSGHMVPYDQPKWALKLITGFAYGLLPFN